MNPLKIILSTLIAAIAYGIIHDMITAHLCVEYFTIGHPKIIESESPILLALTWGVIATWWVALPMGILIAAFNHLGKRPSLEFNRVLKLIVKLMLFMFGIALFSGIIGYVLSEMGIIYLVPRLADQIPPSKHSEFLAAGWAHSSSYLSGVLGTAILCRVIYRRRKNYPTSHSKQ